MFEKINLLTNALGNLVKGIRGNDQIRIIFVIGTKELMDAFCAHPG
jgi:hypothetical protein